MKIELRGALKTYQSVRALNRQLTFRILAPKAEVVPLGSGGDIPRIGFGQNKAMTKGAEGIWEATVGPLAPGAYRYRFNVDAMFDAIRTFGRYPVSVGA